VLVALSWLVVEFRHWVFQDDQTIATALLVVTADVLRILALIRACWLVPFFVLLIVQWSHGNPEGHKFVDEDFYDTLVLQNYQ
jgi:hypothetical protein